jgi:hypothetical protein
MPRPFHATQIPRMHLQILSTLALLLFHGLSNPITLVPRQSSPSPFLENLPWYLTNLVIFEPADSTTQSSAYIMFNIADKNPGLELSSSCQYFTAWGVPAPVTPGGGYVQCLDQDVRFKYDGQSIFVERGWLVPDNQRLVSKK